MSKFIGYDVCPDCEGNGEVKTDTADLNCISCEGTGYVAYNLEGYIPYNPKTKQIGIKKVKWIKKDIKRQQYIQELLNR